MTTLYVGYTDDDLEQLQEAIYYDVIDAYCESTSVDDINRDDVLTFCLWELIEFCDDIEVKYDVDTSPQILKGSQTIDDIVMYIFIEMQKSQASVVKDGADPFSDISNETSSDRTDYLIKINDGFSSMELKFNATSLDIVEKFASQYILIFDTVYVEKDANE